MEIHSQPDSLKQQRLDLAHEALAAISVKLREARRILNRDWPHMTPRERSSRSRQVKQLEQQQQALIDEIAMNQVE